MALVRALEPPVPARALTSRSAEAARIDALEATIGHHFTDAALLTAALSHVSAVSVRRRSDSYQRLEFLGDRVLGLAVAEMLYEAFPAAPEGDLSRRLSELVRKETCADVARDWRVGDFVKLGAGEESSGGRDRTAILGDVCEAIIGAVFLDGGFAAGRNLVRRFFAERMTQAIRPTRDPKTMLQEWAQARGKKPPSYRELQRAGPDHKPVFRVGVDVDGCDPCEAEGASKRLAEQAAASAFMEREKIYAAPVSRRNRTEK